MHSLTEPKTGRTLLLILAVAILLRAGVALYLGDTVPPGKDETSYFALGARIATGHGFSFDRPWYPFTPAETPTAHWSFLYALVVAAVYTVAGPHPLAVRLVSAVVSGLLLPWLAYRLADRVTGGGGQEAGVRGQESEARSSAFCPLIPASCLLIPVLAAFMSAGYPYFVLYGAMVQTEAFYICALLWSLERALALVDLTGFRKPVRSGAVLGLSLGIATLLRQSILPWAVVLFAWLLWQAVRGSVGPTGVLRKDRPQQVALPHEIANSSNSWCSWQSSVASLIIAGLVLLACIAPFTIRNTIVYGDFLLLNSNAGYAMYSAQHPMHGVSFQEYAAAPLPADLWAQGLNEAQWDQALMQRGIGFVLAEPGRYLLLSLSRVPDYFEFWPKPGTSLVNNIGRIASFGLFLPFMGYGVWLALRPNPRPPFPAREGGAGVRLLLAFVAFYSLLHILTWAMPRYRLPADAVLLIFAAVGLAASGQRLRLGFRASRGRSAPPVV